MELTFFKEKDGPWGSSGSIAVALVDTAFRLIAAYEEEGDDNRFRFRQQLDSAPIPVTLPGVGSLALSAMELRRAQSSPAEVRWQVLADAALSLSAIPSLSITLYGTSTVPPEGAEAGIAFEAFSNDARNRISQQIAVAGLEPLPRIVFTPRRGLISRQGDDWTVDGGRPHRVRRLPAVHERADRRHPGRHQPAAGRAAGMDASASPARTPA